MSSAVDRIRTSCFGTSWNIPPLVRRGALGGELPAGFRLGRFTVVHLRALDTNCEVYLARDAEGGAPRTVRVARSSVFAAHPGLADTMLHGARLLAGRSHPHLLAVLDGGWTDEAVPRPYVVHERLVGRDLATYQARHRGIEPSLLPMVAEQCAAALDALHRLGLAHTDLRRSCVMLVPLDDGRLVVKLAGLEHARPIRPGATAADEPLVAADLAAFGVMLRELGGDGHSAELARAIARLTATDPARRPASAAEVHRALIGRSLGGIDDVLAGPRTDHLSPATLAHDSCVTPQRTLAARQPAPTLLRADGQTVPVSPRLRTSLLLALVALLVSTTLGIVRPPGEPRPRRLSITPDEPTPHLVAPRTMPERVQPPASSASLDHDEPERPAPAAPRLRRAPLLVAMHTEETVPKVDEAPTTDEPPLPLVAPAASADPTDEEPALLPIIPSGTPSDDLGLLPVRAQYMLAHQPENGGPASGLGGAATKNCVLTDRCPNVRAPTR